MGRLGGPQSPPGFQRLGHRLAQGLEDHAIGHRLGQAADQGAHAGEGLEGVAGHRQDDGGMAGDPLACQFQQQVGIHLPHGYLVEGRQLLDQGDAQIPLDDEIRARRHCRHGADHSLAGIGNGQFLSALCTMGPLRLVQAPRHQDKDAGVAQLFQNRRVLVQMPLQGLAQVIHSGRQVPDLGPFHAVRTDHQDLPAPPRLDGHQVYPAPGTAPTPALALARVRADALRQPLAEPVLQQIQFLAPVAVGLVEGDDQGLAEFPQGLEFLILGTAQVPVADIDHQVGAQGLGPSHVVEPLADLVGAGHVGEDQLITTGAVPGIGGDLAGGATHGAGLQHRLRQ